MRLIGMLDSPFVRRVAVSMNLMGLGFISEPISVFRGFDEFAGINPLVKAPTLVTDDGIVLVDSGVILAYLETLAPERSLSAFAPEHRAAAFRLTGLGIAACEKAVQLVYERQLRPAENQLASWEARVIGQIGAALDAIEAMLPKAAGWLFANRPLQPDISCAIAWCFVTAKHPGLFDAGYPRLAALSTMAEASEAFAASPYDEG